VKDEEVPKNALTFSCDNIQGTMKLHSILVTNKNNLITLMVKDLTCFYIFSFDGKWVDCQNIVDRSLGTKDPTTCGHKVSL
jgi:hypothetical protein